MSPFLQTFYGRVATQPSVRALVLVHVDRVIVTVTHAVRGDPALEAE
jgi:hypothetical protein